MNVTRLRVLGLSAVVGSGAALVLYTALAPTAGSASAGSVPTGSPAVVAQTAGTAPAAQPVMADCVPPAALENGECVTRVVVVSPTPPPTGGSSLARAPRLDEHSAVEDRLADDRGAEDRGAEDRGAEDRGGEPGDRLGGSDD